MEAIRGYLPKLRVPSLAQLRDGSFLSRAIQKYEEEAEHSIIRDFEVRPDLVTPAGDVLTPHCSITEQTGGGPGGGCLVQPHRQYRLGGSLPDPPLLSL